METPGMFPLLIVEALLGEDFIDFCAGDKHVAVVTSDGEVFTWGDGEFGRLGLESSSIVSTPDVVDLDEDVEKVFCGPSSTALLAPDGRLYIFVFRFVLQLYFCQVTCCWEEQTKHAST
jgi:alpha-tubulin suppressor-like RCC1 family protein